ncbi:MAG: fimbrial assembly protein FimA [Chloroflexi bacterium RBG_13_68_17]|nr:MAG: fimbrial assembly protein FimA [Chloroflexi bacterium RBG_13_68_17]
MQPRLSTFSLVAWDPVDRAWGVAVASKFPAVGARVPWAASGAGAVATQSYANTTFGPRGLTAMAAGHSAQRTLDELLAADPERERRQVGLIDARGQSATFTGRECQAWAGGRAGPGYAAQGNILAGAQVVDALTDTFLGAAGDLPGRLMAALLAADRAGGDRRGRQSAALYVAKAGAGYGGLDDIWIDYRVDDHPDPVHRLAELLDIHRLYFGKSPPEDELPLDGETLLQLQTIARRLGHYRGDVHGLYDAPTRAALEAWIGSENFEDRTDFGRRRIDRPVFEYLRTRFGQ